MKWEYKIITLQAGMMRSLIRNKDVDTWNDKLNELGKDGWELTGVTHIGITGTTTEVRCFFKRKV